MSKADVQAGIDGCVAAGWIVEVKPGLYRMTTKGERKVESMGADWPCMKVRGARCSHSECR